MSRSYSSSAALAVPTAIDASSAPKNPTCRPAYIGLPWRRPPGVPSLTSTSSRLSECTMCSGTNAPIDPHAVRSAAPQADHVAPVVDDLPALTGDRHEQLPAGELVVLDRPRSVLEHRPGHEMRRPWAARAVVPRAVDEVAAIDRSGGATRRVTRCAAELPDRAEHLTLGALGVEGTRLQRVCGIERQAPARGRTSARNLDDHAVERGDVELIAAEHPRLQDAVEAGVRERLVHLLAGEGALLRGGLIVEQPWAQRLGAADHICGRQARLRNRQRRRVLGGGVADGRRR